MLMDEDQDLEEDVGERCKAVLIRCLLQKWRRAVHRQVLVLEIVLERMPPPQLQQHQQCNFIFNCNCNCNCNCKSPSKKSSRKGIQTQEDSVRWRANGILMDNAERGRGAVIMQMKV